MFKPQIKVIYLSEDVPKLAISTEGSAGYDLYASNRVPLGGVEMPKGHSFLVGTGISVHIQNPNIVGLVVGRSGLAKNYGVRLANCVGVIDSDYQGEIQLVLTADRDNSCCIYKGQKVAQLLFVPVIHPILQEVHAFSEQTTRATGGFGSTGA